jgi:transcription elongation factor S-II
LIPSLSAGGSGVVPTPKLTGDSTRDKGRKLLAESLHTATTEEQNHDEYLLDVAELAADIEQAMFSQFGGTNKQYMAKFRNLRFNLKDPKNPDLRGRVVRGDVSPADLVTLSSEALASREVQEKNEKIREWAMFEAERGKHNKQASTDQFQCAAPLYPPPPFPFLTHSQTSKRTRNYTSELTDINAQRKKQRK